VTRLVLLRHGRTEWNATGRYQGHEDVPLSDEGRRQAYDVAPAIAAMSPSMVRTSDLSRASETADVVARACGLEATRDERLRERFVGPFAGLTADQIRARHPEAAEEFFAGRGPLGTHSDADVAARVAPALEEYADLLGRHGTGVVVSHGWAIRTTVTTLIGAPHRAVRGLDNCGWAELARDRSGWHLLAWNRVAVAAVDGGAPARTRAEA
jgi:probable phosphoglycerate mutase